MSQSREATQVTMGLNEGVNNNTIVFTMLLMVGKKGQTTEGQISHSTVLQCDSMS